MLVNNQLFCHKKKTVQIQDLPYLKAGIWNFKAIWGGIQDFFINRPFPHSYEQRHQLKVQVDKTQWFVRNCPLEPRAHFYVLAHWSIDFSMCNYDNILFLYLTEGAHSI